MSTHEPAEGWEGQPVSTLAERWGVGRVHAFRRLGSTNDYARVLAGQGAPAGTVVLAEEQVAGRGRAGRVWSSAPGLGVWLSLIARPATGERVTALPLVVGLEVARALDGFLQPRAVGLKWPNDLVLDGRKVGGILCEASWTKGSPGFVVVGIGINVRHSVDDFPAELRAEATSLRLAGAPAITPAAVADRLVPALRVMIAGGIAWNEQVRTEVAARDVLRGRSVTITDPRTGMVTHRGTAAGIGPSGALLIRDAAGERREIHAGTARPSSHGSIPE